MVALCINVFRILLIIFLVACLRANKLGIAMLIVAHIEHVNVLKEELNMSGLVLGLVTPNVAATVSSELNRSISRI